MKKRTAKRTKLTPSQEYKLACWYRGFLRWQLRAHGQRTLYDFIEEWKKENPRLMGPILLNCHRRIGKTRLGVVKGVERCIQKPDQEVRIIAPSTELCDELVRPQLDQVLRSAPDTLMPKSRGNTFVFRNPLWGDPDAYSSLYLSGSEYKKGNRERGKGSNLVILDEFRDMEDPNSLIDDIISYHFVNKEDPLLLILSTPPHTMDHPMVKRFIPKTQQKKSYYVITVEDNPDFTEEDERMLLEVCETKESISWKREALCQLISDPANLVIPEFVELENAGKINEIVVDSYERPAHYYPQTCIDTGYDDYNGAVFFYIDFLKDLIVIEGELWVNQQNSKDLKEMIEEKERKIFPNPPHPVTRHGDLPKQLHADLAEILGFIILPVNKTEKVVSIRALRTTVRQKRIRIIGPKCPILIYQLRNGTYSKNRKDFIRKEHDDELGHCDLLAALIYGHRMAPWDAQPYPDRKLEVGTNFIYIPTEEEMTESLEVEEEYEIILSNNNEQVRESLLGQRRPRQTNPIP